MIARPNPKEHTMLKKSPKPGKPGKPSKKPAKPVRNENTTVLPVKRRPGKLKREMLPVAGWSAWSAGAIADPHYDGAVI